MVEESDGVSLLQTAQEQKTEISHALYAWIDTWSIDQSESEDRNRQIPMMVDIYKQAHAVVVVVRHKFLFTQADWDVIIENLEDPIIRVTRSSWATSAAYDLYRSDRYAQHIQNGLRTLLEICDLLWMKRVWTAQGYALAAAVIFIGEDLRAFQCLPKDMNDLLSLNQVKTGEPRNQCGNLLTLNNIRNRWIDLTLIMDLAKDRAASYEVDEIYGLKGASEVTTPPLQHLTVDKIWRL